MASCAPWSAGMPKTDLRIVFHRGEETDGDLFQLGGVAVRPLVRRAMVFERVCWTNQS